MVGNGKGGILMAYVIGSANGKKKANEMKTGESWTNPTDGSTWTKQSDGSVSVKTSAGETFNNAYSPTSSGGSSVGSSKNSQYTGVGTHNDASASAWAKNQINYYKEQYNNAIKQYDRLRGNLETLTKARDLAAQTYKLSQNRFASGQTSAVELADVSAGLYQLDIALLSTKYNILMSAESVKKLGE